MMKKYNLKYIDVMVQYACSLSCKGCIVMSNYDRKGHVSWKEGEQWLKEWSTRINPTEVNLMGGEPLLNKDFEQWLYGVREIFPNSRIKFITNGFHYKVRPNLYQWCKEVGNILVQTSLHYRPPPKEFVDNIMFFLKQTDWKIDNTPFTQAEKLMMLTDKNASVKWHMNLFGEFRRPFMGEGADMYPANNDDYEGAHRVCGSPSSPIIYRNKLYKCPAIANLEDTLKVFGKENEEQWAPYLNSGLNYDSDLVGFIDNYNKPNSIVCKACSSNTAEIEYDHYEQGNVITRKEYNKIK